MRFFLFVLLSMGLIFAGLSGNLVRTNASQESNLQNSGTSPEAVAGDSKLRSNPLEKESEVPIVDEEMRMSKGNQERKQNEKDERSASSSENKETSDSKVHTQNKLAAAAVNNPPVLTSISASPNPAITADTVTLKVIARDENPNTLSYQWFRAGSNAPGPAPQLKDQTTATPSFIVPKLPPGNNYLYSYAVVVRDDGGKVVSGGIAISVSLGNPPRITSIAISPIVGEHTSGSVVTISSKVTDEHPNSLSYKWSQVPGQGPRVILQGSDTASVSFTVPKLVGPPLQNVVIRMIVTDDSGQTAFSEILVRLKASDFPVINSITTSPNPAISGDTVGLKAQVTDENPKSLIYVWSQLSGPSVNLKGANTASPTFIAPKVTSSQTLVFNLFVRDETGLGNGKTTQVVILPNNPPAINSMTANPTLGTTGETVKLNAQVTDEHPNTVTFKWVQVSGPSVRLSDANTASPSFVVPSLTQPTSLFFRLTISDDFKQTVSKDLEVTVEPPNNPPVIQSLNFFPTSPISGDRVGLSAQISDEHPNTLTGKWEQTAGPSVTLSGGNSFIAPDVSSTTALSFKFTVTDDLGQTDSDSVTIIVSPAVSQNNPPQAQPQSVTAVSGTAKEITLSATDPDTGDTLTYSVVSGPQHGSLTAVNSEGKTTYTSNNAFTGSDSFTFKVTDNHGADSTVETVSITVQPQPPQNNLPVAQDQDVTAVTDTAKEIILFASDPDTGDTLTYSVVGAPQNGVLTTIDSQGKITYTPNSGFTGSDTFTFKATDNHGADSNDATVSITVQEESPENNPPQASDQTFFVSRLSGTLILDAFDPDIDDTVTWTVIDQPEHVTITGITAFTFEASADYTKDPDAPIGVETFTYRGTDNHGAQSNVATVTLNVLGN